MHIKINLQDFHPDNGDRLTLDLNPLYPGVITLAPYGEDNIWLARWTDEGEYFEADNPYDALVCAMASRSLGVHIEALSQARTFSLEMQEETERKI